MRNNSLLAWGLIILVLAALAIVLIGGSWDGSMMGPGWTISPMGGTMSIGVGGIFILIAGTVGFTLLAAWVLRSTRQK